MEQRMDLKQFLEVLKRRLIAIILTTLVVFGVSIVVSLYVIKPTYQATEYILIGTFSDEDALVNSQKIDRLLASSIDFIESPIVVNTVKSKYGFENEDIEESVSVQNSRNSQIVNVIAQNSDPEKTTELAHAIASTSVEKMEDLLKVDQIELLSNKGGETTLKRIDNPIVNMVIGLTVGLFMGIGLALIKEHFDDTIANSNEVESLLGLRVLGEVDAVKAKMEKKMIKENKRKIEVSLAERKGGEIRA
ncbi:YveK family protein [Anaerobacillus sp. 1_MG-2023]|uniref:YveK family protein n=1 Tax=Bacillales TaxID=1385 RepID=UPI0026E22180|nr:Wzz/FepE/Etk N-terminal domain-containing protein [Anaerobacillus sp. 1_MG-2023]MDO6657818.1 Wzz/FepE/Etk N-terminal domain-containing protein [Anaerobacillus sp. 1_MG-2023]